MCKKGFNLVLLPNPLFPLSRKKVLFLYWKSIKQPFSTLNGEGAGDDERTVLQLSNLVGILSYAPIDTVLRVLFLEKKNHLICYNVFQIKRYTVNLEELWLIYRWKLFTCICTSWIYFSFSIFNFFNTSLNSFFYLNWRVVWRDIF